MMVLTVLFGVEFLCCLHLMYVFIYTCTLTEWPRIGKITANSAYDTFSEQKKK